MRTTVAVLVGAVVLTGGLTACSGGSSSSPQSATATTPASASPAPAASVTFAAPAGSGTQPAGVTYDVAKVPAGAKATVVAKAEGSGTQVNLSVNGLLPNQQYGAHVHTKPCGAKPADSGPHYQDRKDPVTPSVDPAYANAENEVWLDFTTDAKGDAAATATVKWSFRDGEANAAVIHAMHTSTEHGKAGTAGDRLACVTADF